VRWKVPLPGKAHSSPIVFGDSVYVLAAVPVGEAQKPVYDDAPGVHDSVPVTHRHQFIALALSRRDGSVLWKKVLREEWPHEGGHVTGSLASSSPVTDGERLYVFFGSRGLYCLDLRGDLKWSKDLGKMRTLHAHGEGSSPVLHGDTLIVCWDQEGDSLLYAFDKRTGKQLWKVQRDEKTAWSTPLVVEHEGKPQVIVSATKRVRGYDLRHRRAALGMRRPDGQRRVLRRYTPTAWSLRGTVIIRKPCSPSASPGRKAISPARPMCCGNSTA
jgi:outer membrane protein assembly factor BamB